MSDEEVLALASASPHLADARAALAPFETVAFGNLSTEAGAMPLSADAVHLAAWAAPRAGSNEHVIWVNPKVLPRLADSRSKQEAVIRRAVRHESWHARLTDRDTGLLHYACDALGIPPQAFNLFEDARIEDYARYAEGERFGYFGESDSQMSHKRMLAKGAFITHPLVLFQYFTLCENEPRHSVHAHAAWNGAPTTTFRGKQYRTTELVEWFFRRAMYATNTRALIPLLLEFIEAFPSLALYDSSDKVTKNEKNERKLQNLNAIRERGGDKFGALSDDPNSLTDGNICGAPPIKMAENGEGEGTGEGEGDGDGERTGGGKVVSHAYGGLYDDSNPPTPRDKKEAVAFTNELTKGPETKVVTRDRSLVPFSYLPTGVHAQAVLSKLRASHGPDLSSAPAIARALRRMVGFVDSSRTRSATNGSRLHMSNIISGQPDAFRHTVYRKGKRKVCCVMDMSGSMSPSFRHHGGAFLEALLSLGRNGTMDVVVWLSGGGKCARLDHRTTTDDVAGLYASHGCESIMATLEKAKEDLVSADTVIVYTDGELTDGDIDTERWRSRGVDLIGAMAVAEEHIERIMRDPLISGEGLGKAMAPVIAGSRRKMESHFHKCIIAGTGYELAMKIGQYVLSRQ